MRRKTIKRLFWILILLIVAAGGVFTYGGYQKYCQALTDKPIDTVVRDLKMREDFTA